MLIFKNDLYYFTFCNSITLMKKRTHQLGINLFSTNLPMHHPMSLLALLPAVIRPLARTPAHFLGDGDGALGADATGFEEVG